jgi:hypothetical protein
MFECVMYIFSLYDALLLIECHVVFGRLGWVMLYDRVIVDVPPNPLVFDVGGVVSATGRSVMNHETK